MNRKGKKVTAVLAAVIALLVIISSSVYAIDTDYSGYLDPETDEPLGYGSTDVLGTNTGRVIVSGTLYYDWQSHDFVYASLESLAEIHTNAIDEMVVTTPVSITSEGNTLPTVYRDGSEYEGDIANISETGDYVVSVMQSGSPRRLFGFTIVGDTTNSIETFTVPEGFYITSATRDGEVIATDRYSVNMSEEGEYSVNYECFATDIIYNLTTTIDRTAPEIEFSGKQDAEGRYHSAVKFSGFDREDTITLMRTNGEEGKFSNNGDGSATITENGNYVMRVYDPAGNMSQYDVIILMYFNISSIVFFLLVILTVGAVAAYIYIKRKTLKIG